MTPPPSHLPLLDRWTAGLREPDRAALLDPSGGVLRTFAGIEAEKGLWTVRLAHLERGAVVGVQIGNDPAWPALFLALLELGLVMLPLDASLHPDAGERILQTAGAAVCVGPGGVLRSLTGMIRLEGVALLKVTSGSTGGSRLIRFTGGQLLADAEQIVATMGLRPDDLNYGVIPFSHSYGFSNLLTPLLAHGIPLVVATDILPRALLEGLQATGATVLPGIPLIYQSLLRMEDAWLPETLRLCISAGAPLSAATIREFHGRFGRKVHSFYGASECGGICYDASESAEVAEGFVGEPMNAVTLEVEPGVRVSGPAVGMGYFPEEEATMQGGVFRPGDLLERLPAGWRIAGRVSDFINVAGKKVNPREIETVLGRCPGVEQAVVFGVPHPRRGESIIAAVVGGVSDLSEEALRRHCRVNLVLWQIPETFWFPGEITQTERGKVNRRELARQFLSP